MSGVQPIPDSAKDTAATASGDWVATYGKGFVGEYVDKLDKVVESYSLIHNFHEGTDVAVVSLRDDVANVRTDCQVQGRNLLKSSADLSSADAWAASNCNPVTTGGVTYPVLNCIQAIRTPDFVPVTVPVSTRKIADLAVRGLRGSESGAPGFKLQFGDGGTTCVAASCGWKGGSSWPPTASAVSQIVTLNPGRYRLSWYTKDPTPPASPVPTYTNGAMVQVIILRGTTQDGVTTPAPLAPTNFVAPTVDGGAGTGWKRASAQFTVATAGAYEVGFGVNRTAFPSTTQAVTIGAPMLDTVLDNGAPSYLAAFQPTDTEGLTTLPACEDTEGLKFRRENWSRQCTHLCSGGFTGSCVKGPEYCYQEFTFGVAQPWIATGKLFKYSGFARGNFNYRIDSVGLNFVGSNARDCSDSSLPSTCYNAGFIPYSIHHTGPFFIRNHAGDDVESLIFDGRIEHARGLAQERYVTNPISSTDRDLMSDYMRTELAGRPLDGTFTIRMWEEPGVDLEGVKDIQLVLNYRYWTAND